MSKKSRERFRKIAIELIMEEHLSSQRKLFEEMKRNDPEIAEFFRPEYEKFLKAEKERIRRDPQGKSSINETLDLLPDNIWVVYLRKRLEKLAKEKRPPIDQKKIKRERREEIVRRLKGEKPH